MVNERLNRIIQIIAEAPHSAVVNLLPTDKDVLSGTFPNYKFENMFGGYYIVAPKKEKKK
jgi:hypothetical protein